jgi:DNA polymerase-3 subunit alpha
LQKALESSPELREAYESSDAAKEIIDTALKVENLKRSAGIHAAGVVIGRDPLVDHLPLKRGDHGEIVTQYDMNGVEQLGLLKMDFLGLRNLTVLDVTREYVRTNRGDEVDVDDLDLADPKVYEMLQRGDSDGIFQLESEGMRRLLALLKPDRFEQIMALIALYRPGPMEQIPAYIERKNDESKIAYLHPVLEDITKETYGILVYQEQIVSLLQKIAGYSPGDADMVRKAIGKKKRDIMAAEEPRFIEGCLRSGLTEEEAHQLWALIQPFADYSFNRAHSASYAYIAYQTAWLKAHYPVEYMAALLTSVKDRKDDKPKYLHMARRMGIPVLLPDVNSSDVDFTPIDDSVRFGLSAIRHVGEGVVEKIVQARKEKGAFESFYDFCRKVDYVCLNKKTIESLIKAGAFESLGHSRKGLLECFEAVCADVIDRRKKEEAGQFSLFASAAQVDGNGHDESPISIEEYPKEILRGYEREVLGLFVSDHPLLGIEGLLARVTDAPLAALPARQAGEVVTIGGLVANLTKRVTRRGDLMVVLELEDLSGASIEVVVFARTYERYVALLRPDATLLIKGRLDKDARDDTMKILASEILEPQLDERPFEIKLQGDSCTAALVGELKDVLTNHPGATQVLLHLERGESTTILRLDSEFSVDMNNGLHAELKALLGSRVSLGA